MTSTTSITPDAKPVLEIRGLRAGYDRVEVLHGIDFDVMPGELLCILGPNGAGKTTLLRTISGIITAGSGSIRYEGRELSGLSPPEIASAGVVQVPENRLVFGEMSVMDNLRLGAFVRRRSHEVPDDIEEMMRHFPILGERRMQRAGALSGGEQQMLAVAMALMARPTLLMLDEPSLGLAPIIVDEVYGHIEVLRQEGMTMVMVEQNVERALAVADRGVLIGLGEIVAVGTPQELRDRPEVWDVYLASEEGSLPPR